MLMSSKDKKVFLFPQFSSVTQLCLILCDPMDCSTPGSSVLYCLPEVKWKSLSRVQLSATPWTVAHHSPVSMGFSRQEYWGGSPCLPNPGIESMSPSLQADSLPSEPPGKPKNAGVGSLYLLQVIFLTQELKPCLLHCRWILYQLSYQGSPWFVIYGLYYVEMCCFITYFIERFWL